MLLVCDDGSCLLAWLRLPGVCGLKPVRVRPIGSRSPAPVTVRSWVVRRRGEVSPGAGGGPRTGASTAGASTAGACGNREEVS
jgi:hypothetical protein